MLTNVMLCISFVTAVVLMYFSVKKVLGVMTEGFLEGEKEQSRGKETVVSAEAQMGKAQSVKLPVKDRPAQHHTVPGKPAKSRVAAAEQSAIPKPRINLRTPQPTGKKKINLVNVGSAKPYRVNIPKA